MKIKSLNDLFKEVYANSFMDHYPNEHTTLEQWQTKHIADLTEENIAKYPAAKKAHKLINSKLYKALK